MCWFLRRVDLFGRGIRILDGSCGWILFGEWAGSVGRKSSCLATGTDRLRIYERTLADR